MRSARNQGPWNDHPIGQIDALVGEVLLLNLLARTFYQEPDRPWLESLISEKVFEESPFGTTQPEVIRGLEILRRWSRTQDAGISEEHFRDIKMDHTRLLIGLDSFPTAPWESVYFNRERLVFQEQTLQVREWYSRFGLQSEKLNQEPDDHIGLELSFVAHLASLALQAADEDPAAFDELLQAQRDFLSEHLLRWAPAWAKLVQQHAKTDFYRGISHLTLGALLAAADVLEIKIPKEVSL